MEIITQPKMNRNGDPNGCAVYVIEHVATGKIYVGSSGDFPQRKRCHLSDLALGKNRNPGLQKAFDSDNCLDFVVFPVESREAAYDHEQKLLDRYRDSDLLLNIAPDAKASGKGLKRSDETKVRISSSQIGREPFNKGKSLSSQHHASLVESRKAMAKPVSVDGVVYPSLNEAARQNNLSLGCVHKRISSKSDSFANYKYI